jgi:uncharacterized protein YqjF (DUF2071 family)
VTPLDRLTPTHRPLGWPIGQQRWRALLFLHWPVPEAALRPHVPPELTIDCYDGTAYLGLIPFVVEQARPTAPPPGVGLRFLETNVRTYVHRDGQAPGVYFFSLDAASRLAVLGARLGFGLPYYHAKMCRRVQAGVVDYTVARHGAPPGTGALALRYRVGEFRGAACPGTLDHFLIERYILHVRRWNGLWSTQVHHPPYPLYAAEVLQLEESLFAADGLLSGPGLPPLVHYASLVDVDIFAPRPAGK